MANPFSYFDRIICISLIDRPDRYYGAVSVFDKLSIPCDFFHAKKHPLGGRVGCFDSHIQVIKQAYQAGAKSVLVFEDDIVPTVAPEYINFIVSMCIPLMQKFSYFQLGYQIMPHQLGSFLNAPTPIMHAANFACNCAHAYSLNRRGMRRVLSTYANFINHTHIDLYFLSLFGRDAGCCLPLLFDQDFCSESDNEVPISLYYTVLRRISCQVHRMDTMYWISMIKKYMPCYIVGFFVLVAVILIIWKQKQK